MTYDPLTDAPLTLECVRCEQPKGWAVIFRFPGIQNAEGNMLVVSLVMRDDATPYGISEQFRQVAECLEEGVFYT